MTNFADGTSALGLACAHAVADGMSFLAIAKAFSAIHRGESPKLYGERNFDVLARLSKEEVP